jgi:hypothetical protein
VVAELLRDGLFEQEIGAGAGIPALDFVPPDPVLIGRGVDQCAPCLPIDKPELAQHVDGLMPNGADRVGRLGRDSNQVRERGE